MSSDDPSVLKRNELYSTLESLMGDLTSLPVRMSGSSQYGQKYSLAVDRPFDYGNKVLLRFAHGKSLGGTQQPKRPFWGKELWGKPLRRERDLFFVYVDLKNKTAQTGAQIESFLNHKELKALRPPSSILDRLARRCGYKVERLTNRERVASWQRVKKLQQRKLKAKEPIKRARSYRMQEKLRRWAATYPYRLAPSEPPIPTGLKKQKSSILSRYLKNGLLGEALYKVGIPRTEVTGEFKLGWTQRHERSCNLLAIKTLNDAYDAGLSFQDEGPRRTLYKPEQEARKPQPQLQKQSQNKPKPSPKKSDSSRKGLEPRSSRAKSSEPRIRPPFTLRSVEVDGKYSTIVLWTAPDREVSLVLPNNTHAWKELLSDSLYTQATQYLEQLGKKVAKPEVDIAGQLSKKNHILRRHQPDLYPDFKVLRRFSNQSGKPLTKHGEHYAVQHKGGPSYFGISDARSDIAKHLLSEDFIKLRKQTPIQQQNRSHGLGGQHPRPVNSSFPKQGKGEDMSHRKFKPKPPKPSYGGR